mmetsp:Transcript_20483/g.22842  ORF Transcript_20483/g.22842 Transcript_20483/m.22842 type:complete len:145 (+) Transcript_20483:73-507(+)
MSRNSVRPDYIKLVQVFAYNYIQSECIIDEVQRTFLMVMKPKHGILCMLDKVFDYFDLEELERMTKVCRLFCFAATLERNYEKFKPQAETTQSKYEDAEIHAMVANCIKNMQKSKAIFSTESTIVHTNSNKSETAFKNDGEKVK